MNKVILKKVFYNFRLFKWALLLSPFGMFVIICIDTYILIETENTLYKNTNKIPYNEVGLLLGTSKFTKNGLLNPYYQNRVAAAVALYKSGKIGFILVSGDNGNHDYNEPALFKTDLIKLGIPENKIYLDYAGFRTLDSVLRAQKIFGLTSFTVISQQFHNERAVFLASKNGIRAIGFNAKEVLGRNALKTNMREYLARTKAFLDVIFETKPKYLGNQICIR